MTDVPIPADRVGDIDGRDPERTPMQWTPRKMPLQHGRSWLPLATDHAKGKVARSATIRRRVLAVRRLNWLRKSSPALRRGS